MDSFGLFGYVRDIMKIDVFGVGFKDTSSELGYHKWLGIRRVREECELGMDQGERGWARKWVGNPRVVRGGGSPQLPSKG